MPASSNGMDWTDQNIATLRPLWGEGHSTAEIGRRMDTSKNAIVGKAHRLNLPPRASPIRGAPRTSAELPPRVRPPVPALATLLPSRPVAPPPPVVPRPVIQAPAPAILAPTIPARAPQPPSARPAVPVAPRSASGCQWPIGEPGKPGFHLCGDVPAPGKPYCASHCGRAYVRMRDGATARTATQPGEAP